MIPTLLLSLVPEVALDGLDPVKLCWGWEAPGSGQITETVGRYTYRFASEKTRELFLGNPERWGIQWGGGCGRMGPLSGVGDPNRWAVVRDRIFIFASDACREGFVGESERFLAPPATWRPLVSIPGVPADVLPTEIQIDRGRVLLSAAVRAHGGFEVIDAATELHLRARSEQSGWKNELDQVVARDGTLRRTAAWTPPDGRDTVATTWTLDGPASVDDGDGAVWISSPDFVSDLERYRQREPLTFLWARDDPELTVWHPGDPRTLDGRAVDHLVVEYRDLRTRLFLDPTTQRILGTAWVGRLDDGVARGVIEIFTEFDEIDGVLVPVARKLEVDGEAREGSAWSDVSLAR